MGGFFKNNPEDTVVGSTDATEDTINENAVTETDSTSSFYRGSPEQTTVDGYVADAAGHAASAAHYAEDAEDSSTRASYFNSLASQQLNIAQSAANQAEEYRDSALQHKNSANISTQGASQHANTASGYANNASQFATTASGHATTAGQYATTASDSASSILNLTVATGAAGTNVIYDAATGVLAVPKGADGNVYVGSYDENTGKVNFLNSSGSNFSTGDLRGADGNGITGGSYDSSTGIATFTSDDGLGFSTSDLRGADGTVDGIDIAARDGVLTTTTTTANNALPKTGGAVTGNITGFIDIRNFYYSLQHQMGSTQSLTTSFTTIGGVSEYTHSGLGTKTIDISLDILYYNVSYTNDAEMRFVVTAPDPSTESVVNLGYVVANGNVSGYQTNVEVSGDYTKYFSKYMGLAKNTGGSNSLGVIYKYYYDGANDRTVIQMNTQNNPPSVGSPIYLHPFDWESTGTDVISPLYQVDFTTDSTVVTRRDYNEHLGYFTSSVAVKTQMKETSSSENVVINEVRGKITKVGN